VTALRECRTGDAIRQLAIGDHILPVGGGFIHGVAVADAAHGILPAAQETVEVARLLPFDDDGWCPHREMDDMKDMKDRNDMKAIHESTKAAPASLPASAQRVADLLTRIGHAQPVVLLPASGRTSAEAAAGLACPVAEIAKSIVFRRLADDRAVIVVASGAHRVDEEKVAARVGALGKADARFVREHTGYAIGGVCPIGHVEKTILLVDQALLQFDGIWAAAGHPRAVFRLSPGELVAMTGGQVADVAGSDAGMV
jgi:prolyl-tRNA editing enzyme YbaK/EbsC (Cys-tRNA(Pro) deacylase)